MENLREIILTYLKHLEKKVLLLNSEICRFISDNILKDSQSNNLFESSEVSLISFFLLGFISFFIIYFFYNLISMLLYGLKKENFQYNRLDNGKILDVIDNVIFFNLRKINLSFLLLKKLISRKKKN